MTVELLPPNATAQEVALDRVTARVSDIPVPVSEVWDPDACPAEVLPFLAWALSVDGWEPAWSEALKRQVIKASLSVHKVKGTLGAIKAALAALDLDTVVEEWFDYGGDPYTFRVTVDLFTRGLTEAELASISVVIDGAKNVRSQLDKLTPRVGSRSDIPLIAGYAKTGSFITVHPLALDEIIQINSIPIVGGAIVAGSTITVKPLEA